MLLTCVPVAAVMGISARRLPIGVSNLIWTHLQFLEMTWSMLVVLFDLSNRAYPSEYYVALQAVIPSEDPEADEILLRPELMSTVA